MRGFLGADRRDFVCRIRLRAISGHVPGVVRVNEWIDPATGRQMHSQGVEFWLMRGEPKVR